MEPDPTMIVLHHGLWGLTAGGPSTCGLSYWNGISAAIAAAGYDVLVTQAHPTGSIQRRARTLKSQIQRRLRDREQPDGRVIILAHSMGGMDARYMISRLDMARQVAALVTIGTAHRGTAYYEWMVRMLDCCGQLSWTSEALWDLRGLWQARRADCHRFNELVPDADAVRYYSVAGVCPAGRVPPWLMPGYTIVAEAEGFNDGRVSLTSARWGRFLGIWPVHHFHLINAALPQLPGDSTEDVIPRYLGLLHMLEEEGLARPSAPLERGLQA
jgi:triacylglycerol lipase